MSNPSITIPGELFSAKNSMEIMPNRGYRKGQPGSRPYFLIKSKAALKAEKTLTPILKDRIDEWRSLIADRPYPLAMKFKIYRVSRRKFDYVNCVQSLLDVMVKCDWLADDSADHVVPVFDHYEVDSENPRTIITILGGGSEITITKDQLSLI